MLVVCSFVIHLKMLPLDSGFKWRMLFNWSVKTLQGGQNRTSEVAVFFVPGIRPMVGGLGEYNTCLQEISKAVPCAVFTLLAALLLGNKFTT